MGAESVVILAFIISYMVVKIVGPLISKSWIRMKKARVTKLQLRSANRTRKKPRKKPRKKIETQYVEGREGWVVFIGIILILFSLLLPYDIQFNFDDSWILEIEFKDTYSGLDLISLLFDSIDTFSWYIDNGYYLLGGNWILRSISPLIFFTSAAMAIVFRGSERLPSYRKSDQDNLAVVRIVGKLHLLYFAAIILSHLVLYRADILLGIRQLIPIDDGDFIMNFGIGIWLGGLSGILIAFPDRLVPVRLKELAGNVVQDIWRGIKDPWIWFARLWISDVAFTSSFDEVRYPRVYYTSIIFTVIYSVGFWFAISIIIFALAAIWVAFGPDDPS